MPRVRSLLLAMGGLAAGLAAAIGCSLHRVAEEPAPLIAPPDAWIDHDPLPATPAEPLPGDAWWSALGVTDLDALIREALAGNLDAPQAVTRVAQAESLRRQAASLDEPQLDAVGQVGETWEEGEDTDFTLLGGLALGWEIDLFGRLREEAKARARELQASRADLAAARLLLSIQVAEAWLQAVEQQLQLALLDEQLELAETLLELTRLRFSLGEASAVDVLQQLTLLEQVRAELPQAHSRLRTQENRIDVLLGAVPDGRDRTGPATALPVPAEFPAAGVPSDLLVRRPDLRALRERLVAADHRVGQAIAERLPRIALTGSFVQMSDPSALAASAAANLVQPLIDWGRREAGVDLAQASFHEALLRFTQTYLLAIEEVETTLWQEARQRELIEALDARRGALKQTVVETRNRYSQGLTDYLPVLTAVQELQEVERELLTQRRALVSLRVRLHAALGGDVPSV